MASPKRAKNGLTRQRESGTFRTMTIRSRPGARVRSPLTELENEVMQAVWDEGPCPVEAVYLVVSKKRDLKETSVRTILRRLEQKGYLRHEEKGRAYVYRAAEPARSLAARAVRQIIDRFCKGSVEELVSGMVEAKMLSNREMDQLEEFVRGAKRAEGAGAKGGK
jgi:BlaI family penicillinase repressor